MLLVACGEPTTPTPQVALAANLIWSGGPLTLRSPAFRNLQTLPAVFVSTIAVPVTRIDDSTLEAIAPVLTGTFQVTVQLPELVSAGIVTLVGFQGEIQGPLMSGQVTWVNPGSSGAPLVFSSGDSGGVLVDLTTTAVVGTVPDSITSPDCAMSPGSSYRGSGYFTLQGRVAGTCGEIRSWQVYPTLVRQDTSPIYAGGQWYVMTEVGSQRWFSDQNNHSWTYDCSGVSCNDRSWVDPSGPTSAITAAQVGRFTWAPQDHAGSGSRPAVLSATTFDTAYTFGFEALNGAVFSAAGDTLVVFGQDSLASGYATTHLLALRASDGAVVHKLSLDSTAGHFGLGASAMALDPAHPWLYLATILFQGGFNYVPALIIVDRSTWKVVGVSFDPNPSGEAFNDFRFNSLTVVPYPSSHQVYVVTTAYGYGIHETHSAILRFATP